MLQSFSTALYLKIYAVRQLLQDHLSPENKEKWSVHQVHLSTVIFHEICTFVFLCAALSPGSGTMLYFMFFQIIEIMPYIYSLLVITVTCHNHVVNILYEFMGIISTKTPTYRVIHSNKY